MVTKKKILLIDDEEDFCFFISKNLENTGGLSVVYATDPDKGIEIARKAMPDLILLDIRMPKKDGFKVLEILKEDTKTISIPVIILTALEDNQSKLRASWLYTERYITKPVDHETLRMEIERILESSAEKRLRTYYENKAWYEKGGSDVSQEEDTLN
jgi:DNA-binding response OmpR family regulator